MHIQSAHIDSLNIKANAAKEWFDNVVHNLRFDEQLYQNDIMPDERKEVLDNMISGNQPAVHGYVRQISTQYFIENLLNEYINELLGVYKKSPKKLGLELSDSKILVWAEIKAEDEAAENALILSQAKVNSKYEQYGFHISSTIVDENDNLEIPNHYTKVAIPA
jgi:hypothetical protein